MRLIAIFLFLLISSADGQRWMSFKATAYSVDGETASGAQTREGRTVAADPEVLPAGTRIEIAGAET
jgi:3D (Asp-Asp-Asp) domain-containing protein